MTTMWDALTAFLLARIAEDEADARAATQREWWALDDGVRTAEEDETGNPMWVVAAAERADRVHIARHDPARVLAECEAKRRIVEQARTAVAEDDAETDTEQGWVTSGVRDALDHTVRLLAQPYADHPDYREEWAL